MAEPTLAQQAARLPESPGVYLFKDDRGHILYIGKARDLRARVHQYLRGHDQRPMVPQLVAAAASVDVIPVHSEREALLLEGALIQEHRPRFNSQFKNDSGFLYIELDLAAPSPRPLLVRIDPRKARAEDRRDNRRDGRRDGKRDDLQKARLRFGPWHASWEAARLLDTVHRHFPLRTCTDAVLQSRKRPCLLHQMHRCAAPCTRACTEEEYAGLVEGARLFLSGQVGEVIARMEDRMLALAEAERFEEAARVRDRIKAIQAGQPRQSVITDLTGHAWAVHREGVRGVIACLPVEAGAVRAPALLPFDHEVADTEELLATAMHRFYGDHDPIQLPPMLLLPSLAPKGAPEKETSAEIGGSESGAPESGGPEIGASAELEAAAEIGAPAEVGALIGLLAERRGGRIALVRPKIGEKRAIWEIARKAAEAAWLRRNSEEERRQQALSALAELLGLTAPPRRIECFDNSNLQGAQPVAAMVVFIDGKPARAEYRRYHVKTVVGADDFASMREILLRRLSRGLDEGDLPDLLVVDGGKGQVSAAVTALADLGLSELPLIGITKPRTERRRGDWETTDRIVIPGQDDLIAPRADHPGLRLLQHLRDQAHETAIEFHRKQRSKQTIRSALDDLPGIGPARRKALLTTFGSIKGVREASEEALIAAIGKAGASVYAALHPAQATSA